MFNFGFSKVLEEEKYKLVSDVFSSVANRYNLMNNVMSFGVQKLWKQNFLDFIYLKDGGNYLDLATGTGDIAIMVLEKAKKEGKQISITISDANADMLEIAKKRFTNQENITFICANAEEFPLSSNHYDACFVSFGIRNFTNINKSFEIINQNLKPSGSLYALEFFPDVSKLFMFHKIYKAYLLNVIPLLGKLIVKDEASYKYFAESILNFYTKKDFTELAQNCNFKLFAEIDSVFGIVSYFNFRKI